MSEVSEKQMQEYSEYVKKVTPTHNLWMQMVRAFLVGGIICCLGQFILNTAANMGLDKQTAGSWCSLLLVLLSVLLTGFGIYSKLVKWGGAGALVPITGFANSVASCAVEYSVEGQVYGFGIVTNRWGAVAIDVFWWQQFIITDVWVRTLSKRVYSQRPTIICKRKLRT